MKLPPYGVFEEGFEASGRSTQPMTDWESSGSRNQRESSYKQWRTDLRQTLADAIWPYFDRDTHDWKGDARNWAEKASFQEIDLMIGHFQGSRRTVGTTISSGVSDPEFGETHRGQFKAEDDPNLDAGVNLRDYVLGLTAQQFQHALWIIDAAYRYKKLSGLFWFKWQFVRTRPYQAAFLQRKYGDFRHLPALSARHSSFHSGHCLEGIMFSAALAEDWMSKPREYSQSQIDALAQYAVDFGDRRVFAGVHYPSDNVGSWVIALSAIPHLYQDPAPILDFVKNAIKTKSAVYKLIDSEYANHQDLRPTLDLLRAYI